ncbi:double-strand break repair protein AddB [Tropicibacter sp. Alg240-R139]|uniref:double-strand break repair protein AddB n=1 Tax=Tropicibacter sp. Alg240-R139 TaxID=2305991 RepID=UPI0013E0643F|nr:double-strand break repair protein AddB [Tropicibacter sp. Alg240-R139]
MFETSAEPRVFAEPPGVDFPAALVQGLHARAKDYPPEALARVQLVVNTRRMKRRVRDLFDAGPPCLLPQISLITDLGETQDLSRLPPAIPPLRRRLQLTQLVSHLLDQQPDLAARSSLYDLSDSLADLIDEMQSEGVSPQAIRDLDVSDLSGHWARTQQFIAIADRFIGADELDVQARQRKVVENLIHRWEIAPPQHPIILAGSTGSRGTTLMLMEAIARLPQGALILPGYDFDQPASIWSGVDDALLSEDHPQYRFRKLTHALELEPADVQHWTGTEAPSPARNQLVSLALRPAPVTDAWMTEGAELTDLPEATKGITLVEAPSPRSEALAIALRLRQAAEDRQTAALITPDRMLTRQVSAALDRWSIIPDDSAGLPLQLSPPGRFLRHVAGLFVHRLDGEALLTLLKHPLCHMGGARGEHLRQTRDLELDLRRYGPPFPDFEGFHAFAARRLDTQAEVPSSWLTWLGECFVDQQVSADLSLIQWVERLRNLAERISIGSAQDNDSNLWDKNNGQKALEVFTKLEDEALHGGRMTARDFTDLIGAILADEEVRDRDAPHDHIMIWGTLEARVHGADLLILGGLNEGSWPEVTKPDPWLNRQMRDTAGLLLPERRIGLSAHDFQQAVCAQEVWLTRATRSDDAETVASRWVNRLTNLLRGLPDQGGPEMLKEMKARGQLWLDRSDVLERAPTTPAAARPSPRPPVAARPRRMSVTEIKRLIRDPYAIYAKHVLRLKRLNPLVQAPDALLRGIVVHEVLEKFIADTMENPNSLTREAFVAKARALLDELVAWPTARKLWMARIERVADAFLVSEHQRRAQANPIAFEARLKLHLDPLDFELVGRADRIDQNERGDLYIYDYKTGAPPTPAQQSKFDKQLLIEAAMAEEGGLEGMDPMQVADAVFIGVGGTFKEVPAPLEKEPPAKVWAELRELIEAYFDPEQGYTARRMLHRDADVGDYDHLARFGEWDRTTAATPEDLT